MRTLIRKAFVYALLLLAGSMASAAVDTKFLQGLGTRIRGRTEITDWICGLGASDN